MKEGRGVEIFETGDRYEGQFKANKREGRGTYSFKASGHCYEGEWKGGLMHGKGKKFNPKTKVVYYEGEWYND